MNRAKSATLAYQQAMKDAKDRLKAGDTAAAFALLERAHVLGQRQFWPHWAVHLWMLRVAFVRSDAREAIGQLWRLFLTPFGHLTGRLPLGNTGGANVSAFAPMEISVELRAIMQADEDQAKQPVPTRDHLS